MQGRMRAMSWFNPGSPYYYSALVLLVTCAADVLLGCLGLLLYVRDNYFVFLGNRFIKENNVPAAIKAFERHAQKHPKDKQAKKILCELYVRQEAMTENAIALYKEVLSADMFQGDVCRALAMSFAESHRVDEEARMLYGRALQFFPDTPLFVAMMGRAYFAAGDDAFARDFLGRAVALGYEDEKVLAGLCALYLKKKRYDEKAKDVASSFAKAAPQEVLPHRLLGNIFLHEGNLEEAEKKAKLVLERVPEDVDAQVLMGDVFAAKEDYCSAALRYKCALKQNALSREILKRLCHTFARSERRDGEALAFYRQVENEEDVSDLIHRALYEDYLQKRKYDRARKQLYLFARARRDKSEIIQELLRIADKDADAEGYALLADLYTECGAPENARACFIKALQRNEKSAPGLLECLSRFLEKNPAADAGLYKALAQLYIRDGKTRPAVLILKTAMEYFPEDASLQKMLEAAGNAYVTENVDDAEVHFVLGEMYKKQRRFDDAIRHLQVCEGTPFEERARLSITECFLEKDLPEMSLEHLQKLNCSASFSQDERVTFLYLYGMACERLGKTEEALGKYKSLLGISRDFKGVLEKVEKIQRGVAMSSMQTLAVERIEESRERYEIVNEIEEGTYGIVYLAQDTLLERPVALKILHDRYLFNRSVKERFLKEVRASAGLLHENILHIYDVGEKEGKTFIVMEYAEGRTLQNLLDSGEKFETARIRDMVFQLAGALACAHGKNFLHGKLHPKNIFLKTDGTLKLGSFSLNKTLDEFSNTLSGAPYHDNLYASPEELLGETCDERSDIYSLGVILSQAATGQMPFKNPEEKLKSDLPSLEGMESPLRAVVEKCLQRDRGKRYRSGCELKNELSFENADAL